MSLAIINSVLGDFSIANNDEQNRSLPDLNEVLCPFWYTHSLFSLVNEENNNVYQSFIFSPFWRKEIAILIRK
jgi:hypothetical protein